MCIYIEVCFIASNNLDNFKFDHLQFFKLEKSFEESSYKVDLSTDDWPFLYAFYEAKNEYILSLI